MFVVFMAWATGQKDAVVITKTRAEALEWIRRQMVGRRYNGIGYHMVQEVELYGSEDAMTKREAIHILNLVRGDNPKQNDAVAQAIEIAIKSLEVEDDEL